MRSAAALVIAATAACSPFTVDSLADTRIKAKCHFAFACCNANERGLFDPVDFRDEGTCVSESEQDAAGADGEALIIDAVARDAVARGTATFDADSAQKCSQPILDDVDQCKSSVFFRPGPILDTTEIEALADPADANCFALASRDFTKGTVKDGGACETSIDCADFGNCVPDPKADPNTINDKGVCKALAQRGASCRFDGDCTPGTFCDDTSNTCAALAGDGATCSRDNACQSASCVVTIENGTCFNDPATRCTSDADCAVNDVCNGNTTQKCASAQRLDVQVCTGKTT
jgi:hypothetical protein